MNAEERSKLPPPECCRSCMEYQGMTSPTGVLRSECKKDHPMHADCGFYSARTPSLIGETK